MRNLLFGEKRECGMSLIELLMVIVILGIMAAVAIPTFSVWMPSYRLKTAARDIYSDLQLAKLKAIRSNGDYAVVFNRGAGTYQVVSGGPDRDFSTSGDNVIEKTVTLSNYKSGVSYGTGNAVNDWTGSPVPGTGVSYNPERVVFNSHGMTNDAGYVYVDNENDDKCYAVGTLLTGVIFMQRWNGSTWD